MTSRVRPSDELTVKYDASLSESEFHFDVDALTVIVKDVESGKRVLALLDYGYEAANGIL